jgi:hypothetical protein
MSGPAPVRVGRSSETDPGQQQMNRIFLATALLAVAAATFGLAVGAALRF